MSDHPWLKFYPSDWRSDPALRMCSLAARGLWVEMLAIMHEATPRGHLLVKGKKVTDEDLAKLAGTSIEEVQGLLKELDKFEVFSRKRNGVIFSRRMEKDEQKARKNKDNGKLGGNPSLCKTTQKAKSVKGQDKAQKPEARSQKPDIDSSYEELVQRVWDVSPKKVGKGELRKALKPALKKTDIETIVAGMRLYAESVKGADPHYIKHPASWVRAERWNDEYTANPSQSQQSGNRGGGSFVDAAARFQARRQNLA